jgi:hypothetical protein
LIRQQQVRDAAIPYALVLTPLTTRGAWLAHLRFLCNRL